MKKFESQILTREFERADDEEAAGAARARLIVWLDDLGSSGWFVANVFTNPVGATYLFQREITPDMQRTREIASGTREYPVVDLYVPLNGR